MTLPADKVAELKQVIREQLTQLGVHNRIKECISESVRQDSQEQDASVREEELLKVLRDKGLVEDVMRSMGLDRRGQGLERQRLASPTQLEKLEDAKFAEQDRDPLPLDPARRYLYIQVLGGKAFLEHLQDPEPMPGVTTSTLTLHIHFASQRFQTKPVPCACDPAFNEGFLLELQRTSANGTRMSTAPSLLSMSNQVHFVLVKNDTTGDSVLLSSVSFEWRRILTVPAGNMRLSLELNGIGTGARIPVGILDLRMEIIPRFHEVLAPDVITGQLSIEKGRIAERDRLFLVYARQWWREFLQIRSSHSNRLVKIFAQDENGIHRPSCSYVQALRAGRLIDTPRQAARFVSLLAFEKAPSIGGQRTEIWTSMHALVSRKRGDVEDHACLLCSLLLGFGLNAYVSIGTKTNGTPTAWVVTLAIDGGIVFWESLTAQRYVHHVVDPDGTEIGPFKRKQHMYKTVGCLFNNQEFYANSQPTDLVETCNFDLTDQSSWKSISKEAIKSVCGPGITPRPWPSLVFLPSTIDQVAESNKLETELRSLVIHHRADNGLTTVWDDELSYLLSPALVAYEIENTHGLSVGNEEFQHAIRRYIPDGHTFKGFPIQFVHRDARKALAVCLRSAICEEIINCKGDQVRLALRVRAFPYPEDVCAVWIMFAANYRSVL